MTRSDSILSKYLQGCNEAAARMSAEAKRVKENQEAAQSASLSAREAPVSRQEGQGTPPNRPAPRPLTLISGGRDDE